MTHTSWKRYKLGEIGRFKNGVNFNRDDFGTDIPIINVKNLFRGRFATIDNLDCINQGAIKRIDDYKLKKGDILFARSSVKASGAGQVAMVDLLPSQLTAFSGFIIRYRITELEILDCNYLNYLLRSPTFRKYFQTIGTGTTITNLSQETLSNVEVEIPDIDEQRRIVTILSALDDKIELNLRMNTTLEAIAQAIFQRWFVDFQFPGFDGELVDGLPKGWREERLDEIAEFLNGLALQKFPAESETDYLPVIKIRELRQGVTNSSDKASRNIPNKYIINDGDVLFSWSGSLEVIIWSHGQGALNQHLFKVTSKDFPKWFYYWWTKHHLPNFQAIAQDKATTMGHIQRGHLTESIVNVPTREVLNQADEIMSPLLERYIETMLENKTLIRLRDSLLPKLMSGKIRVAE
jgi:type I restriction enzyme S subunit